MILRVYQQTMERIKFCQSLFVIFLANFVGVTAIQLCCPEGEIYSKIGFEQMVSPPWNILFKCAIVNFRFAIFSSEPLKDP